MTEPSILWYDYETSGIDPRADRVMQFGALRTNEALEIIADPVKRYCQFAADQLPNPDALLITGITPQRCQQEGEIEADFFTAIAQEMTQPAPTSCGYNSIRFDDEFTRFGFWRNLIDPYAREWQEGNSRWDLLDVLRMAHDLRPDGIHWPQEERQGVFYSSFRLEVLTAANAIAHGDAHDALADVYATIAMARLLRQAQPKLYDYCFTLRDKAVVQQLITTALANLQQLDANPDIAMLVHTSGMYNSPKGSTTLVTPLCRHPEQANSYLVYDLRHDPEALLNLDIEALQQRLFSRQEDLPEGVKRLAIKELQINR
ncbi:MAG: exodeoxyribonuclease I, partial [Gammaproteobacteria bacterium]|nr:exodeoxyribonuclease I [Gammaproteobacteria bacterium]